MRSKGQDLNAGVFVAIWWNSLYIMEMSVEAPKLNHSKLGSMGWLSYHPNWSSGSLLTKSAKSKATFAFFFPLGIRKDSQHHGQH